METETERITHATQTHTRAPPPPLPPQTLPLPSPLSIHCQENLMFRILRTISFSQLGRLSHVSHCEKINVCFPCIEAEINLSSFITLKSYSRFTFSKGIDTGTAVRAKVCFSQVSYR